MTEVSISGVDFLIDGRLTYPGRTFEGHRIEGMLFNNRAVQATFDDANPKTRQRWAYPDTGTWDPDRNVEEFCAALPSWRDHGVLAFTINFQGGGPNYVPGIYQTYDNNSFTPDGEVKPAYAERIRTVLKRADDLGMVVIVGLFYVAQVRRLNGDDAMWRAADNAVAFLAGTGRKNFVIEFANELEVMHKRTGNSIWAPERAHDLIHRLRSRHPGFIYTISQCGTDAESGRGLPSPELAEAVDFICIHGNGCTPDQLARGIDALKSRPYYLRNPKPIVINEDSPAVENLEVSWPRRVSWGYYDQGRIGEGAWDGHRWVDESQLLPRESRYEDLSGFQTPPINWTINTEEKRAFFGRVAEVTGSGPTA